MSDPSDMPAKESSAGTASSSPPASASIATPVAESVASGGGALPSPDRQTSGGGGKAEGSTFWGWLKQTARLWGFLAFVAIMLLVFRKAVMPFVLGALVAYLLAPIVRFLCRLRIGRVHLPRFAWLILVYVAILGLMALFVTSFVPRVSRDFKRIVQEAPALASRAREHWVPRIVFWVQDNFGEFGEEKPVEPQPKPEPPRIRVRALRTGEVELDAEQLRLEVVQQSGGRWVIRAPQPPVKRPPPEKQVTDAIDRYINELAQTSEQRLKQVVYLGQVFLVAVLNAISTFILVLMISAFALLDPGRILRALRNLVPKSYFDEFDTVVGLIDKGLSGAIRGQLLICVINGVLTWLGVVLVGVKYPLILGILAGVMSLIPIFGSILSSIPIVMVAMVSGSAGIDLLKGVAMLAWIIGIHLLEANMLNPKIIGSAARIHPLVVIFAVVAGERTYGPTGALLAVPLVSAVQAVFIYLRKRVRGELQS